MGIIELVIVSVVGILSGVISLTLRKREALHNKKIIIHELDERFNVTFPESISSEDLKRLIAALNDDYKSKLPSDVDEEINEEIRRLKDGYLNFYCPEQMKLGQKELVTVEIFKNEEILKSIYDNSGLNEIKVGKTMTVKLIGNDFEITSKNTDSQLILNDKKTMWQWDVKPLKYGDKKLELIVTVKIKVQSKDEMYDYPILSKDIDVKINRVYIVSKFWEKNWQWIISTVVGSGILIVILKALGVLPK